MPAQLSITIDPPARSELFVGESLPLRVLATNVGDEALTLRDGWSAVRITLRDERGQERLLAPRPHRLSPVETPAPRTPFEYVFRPGATVDLRADVGEVQYEAVPPGRYQCVISVGQWRAAAFPLALLPPRPTLVSTTYARSSAAWIVDGSELFVRDGYGDPDAGAARRALTARTRLSSVAVSWGAQSWFLAVENGALVAGLPGPVQLLGWIEGPRVTVAAPRLLTPGIARRDRIDWIVAGSDGTQLATLALEPGPRPIDAMQGALSVEPVLPLVLPAGAIAVQADGAPHALWHDGTRVLLQALVDGATPRVLLDRGRPVLALTADTRELYALLDAGADGNLTRVLLALDGTVRHEAAVPPLPEARAWATGMSTIALAERSILVARDGVWRPLVDANPVGDHLRVVGAHWPREWAEWIDPARGLVHAPIE